METGHTVRLVWNPDDHTSSHLHQHQEESRLADWEDACQRLHRLCSGRPATVCLSASGSAASLTSASNSSSSTATWTRRRETWSWGSFALVPVEFWSPLTCWYVWLQSEFICAGSVVFRGPAGCSASSFSSEQSKAPSPSSCSVGEGLKVPWYRNSPALHCSLVQVFDSQLNGGLHSYFDF